MRLTKFIRERITHAALEHRFKEERDSLREEEHQLAETLFAQQFTAQELKLLNSLPKMWVAQHNMIRASVHGSQTCLHFKEYRNAPSQWHYTEFDCSGDLLRKVEAWKARSVKHRDTKHAAAQAIKGALNKVQTTQTLTKAWPEIAVFIPKDVQTTDKTAALAFPISTLNEMLRLP